MSAGIAEVQYSSGTVFRRPINLLLLEILYLIENEHLGKKIFAQQFFRSKKVKLKQNQKFFPEHQGTIHRDTSCMLRYKILKFFH